MVLLMMMVRRDREDGDGSEWDKCVSILLFLIMIGRRLKKEIQWKCLKKTVLLLLMVMVMVMVMVMIKAEQNDDNDAGNMPRNVRVRSR